MDMDEPFVWNRPPTSSTVKSRPSTSTSTSTAVNEDPWDDTLLIQAYEEANRIVDRALDTTVGSSKGKSVKVIHSRTSTGSSTVSSPKKSKLSPDESRKEPEKSKLSPDESSEGPEKSKLSPDESSEGPEKWRVGQFCRCRYEEDGVEYEAKIISIHGNECVVQFIGYGNEEEKELHQLSMSNGGEARCKQRKEAAFEGLTTVTDPGPVSGPVSGLVSGPVSGPVSGLVPDPVSECDMVFRREPESSERTKTGSRLAPSPVVPPGLSPPPCDEAMASMLMSWYMSGYHTGYYKAMQDFKGGKQTE